MGFFEDLKREVENTVNKATRNWQNPNEASKAFNDQFDALGGLQNVATNILTAGVVGYDRTSGKYGYGAASRMGNEFLGEISGNNAKRDAQLAADTAVSRAEGEQAKQIAQAAELKQRQDIQASTYADATRKSASVQSRNILGSSSNFGPTKDFLGL